MKPKILCFDIETAPILGYVWGLFQNDVALNQIKQDWFILSWAAKWIGDPNSKLMYMDQSRSKDLEDDKRICKGIWKLLDEADIVVTQNGKKFDQKKLNARFVINGFQPPSSYKHIDTLQLAKKHFGFTSNKLEYMTDKLCTKYKKLKTKEFQGFELWKACLSGNKRAWAEMQKYNKQDVLSLEELYTKLIPWDSSVNFALYDEKVIPICSCGQKKFKRNGYTYTSSGKYQRYMCVNCGSEKRSNVNLLKGKVTLK